MIFRSKAKKVDTSEPSGQASRSPASQQKTPRDQSLNISETSPQMQSKPKMLLLDLDSDVVEMVQARWGDIVVGKLGQRYEVEKTSSYTPVINHDFLSEHQECDVIIADFLMRKAASGPSGKKHRPMDETDLWAKQDLGYIDNRGLTGLREQETVDRILRLGGVIVVFADYARPHDAMAASMGIGRLMPGSPINLNVWNLASALEYLRIADDSGSTMSVVDTSSLGKLLAKHLPESRFTCTLKMNYTNDVWTPLAVNKFRECVAAFLKKNDRVVALVVPQLANKAAFLDELLTTVLPEYLPDLFPGIATGAWTHRPEYELPRVAELRNERIRIEEEARTAIAALDGQIEAEQATNGWIQDLLTATGDELVTAVKRALAEMGFSTVVDVDEIRDKAGQSRREDLRIEDRAPVLVVDIKGIGGRPTDEDATQANKHALIHSRESKNPEVQGLSIINHERHMPPLERDNDMPFREELLTVADETSLGLMTSFDLYRILVNMRRWKWASGDVTPLLYTSKRVSVVPTHYKFIGTVAGVWPKANAFGVVIENGVVNVGDALAIEGPIYFEELPVQSIRVNNVAVQSATVADQAGFPLPERGAKIREGMRVFVIHRTA